MATFYILKNPSMPVEGRDPFISLMSRGDYKQVIAVKTGFSWADFMLIMSCSLVIVFIPAVEVFSNYEQGHATTLLVGFFTFLVVGILSARTHCEDTVELHKQRGYEQVDIVEGVRTKGDAIKAYLAKQQSAL